MGGISKEFSANKLQEFKIYWGEKGLLKDNWNSIFVDFVRREWVKEKSPNKGAPTQMHRNWQPSSDAYEVLEPHRHHCLVANFDAFGLERPY